MPVGRGRGPAGGERNVVDDFWVEIDVSDEAMRDWDVLDDRDGWKCQHRHSVSNGV